jgi:hypothetical protein
MTETQKSNWNILSNLIKAEHLLHKFMDSKYGWAYITDSNGKRHRIDYHNTPQQVRQLIKQIKQINKEATD